MQQAQTPYALVQMAKVKKQQLTSVEDEVPCPRDRPPGSGLRVGKVRGRAKGDASTVIRVQGRLGELVMADILNVREHIRHYAAAKGVDARDGEDVLVPGGCSMLRVIG